MEKEMIAKSFISSAAYAPSLLPLLSLSRNLNFRCLSPLKANPQRCVVGGTKRLCRVVAARGNLESTGVPTSVPVRVALELLQAGHRYLDVRTPEEFSAGHASGAINVPYMLRFGSGMAKNPKFLVEVSSHFRKDDEIIVGCQKGKRSLMAVNDLLAAGFTAITDIAGGYDAWSQNGLPTDS
ncbi:hypothetical protein AAG906_015869 [Vitis piasezkii]